MNFNNTNHNNSTVTVRVICAIVFSVFTFLYLYFYQANVLAATQHVLSNGVTHYSRFVGAVLITFFLQLLQIGVNSIARLSHRTHSLTYFPSCLLLAFITDARTNITEPFSIGAWVWVIPLLLIAFSVAVFFARAFQPYEPEMLNSGLLSRCSWINLLVLAFMFLFVGLVSNGNEIFHYRMNMEVCLNDGDYAKALTIGDKSDALDASLTMLRVYALSREGQLGERLFSYPVYPSSEALLPSFISECVMYPTDSIYRYLGAVPKQKLKPMQFLTALCKYHKLKSTAHDYILCGYLLDKNIDAFVRELPKFYKIDEHLPKHYQEALTLYTHLRTSPIIIFHSSVMDTDFQDFTDLQNQYSDKTIRKNYVHDAYGNTYWFFYFYQTSK
jgi:hypothetical protein